MERTGDPHRAQLLDALRALVIEAEGMPTPSVERAAARWSHRLESPAEALLLVSKVRAAGRPTHRRNALLDTIALAAVTAVSTRLLRDALTDSLTGLATRARMQDEVDRLVAMSVRSGTPLTAVLLDLDGLKRLNDERGHDAGDAALAGLGRAVRENLRREDLAFRIGGDEFALFLAGSTPADADAVVARIREDSPASFTAGISVYDAVEHAGGVGSWLRAADVDLYLSKARRARARTLPRRRAGRAAVALVTTAASAVGAMSLASALNPRASAVNAGQHSTSALGRSVSLGSGTTVAATPAVVTHAAGRSLAPLAPAVEPPAAHPRRTAPAPRSAPDVVPVVVPVVQVPVVPVPVPAEPPEVVPTPAPSPGLVGGLLKGVGNLVEALV